MRKYIKFIVLFLFAAFLFWFFGRNLDWQEVRSSLRQADPYYLALATFIICIGYVFRAIRWKVLLNPITKTDLRDLFATTTVGYAAIFLIGRAGEIVRPMWLPMLDKRVRPSAALVTLGLERVFDLASLICFFAVNLIWFTAPAGREAEFEYVKLAGYLMLVGVFVGIGMLFIYHRISDRVLRFADRLTDAKYFPRRIKRIILSILKQLKASLGILHSARDLFWASFWTLILWLSIALPTWLVILAFGLDMSFSDSLFVMGWASVGSVVPTPGGAAGAFHAATAGGLIFLNTPQEKAAAVSIAMHMVYFAPAIIFGLYYFFHGDMSVQKFRDLLSGEHAVEELESDAPSSV